MFTLFFVLGLFNVEECVLIAKNTFPFENLHAEKIKSLLIEKKNVSNYYANIYFLKSVWWARKLFNLAPNISALVLYC